MREGRSSVVGSGPMLQAGESLVQNQIEFFQFT
jgi:hypothetical protein